LNLEKRIEKLKSDFDQFSDWEDKYKYIISLGKTLAPLNEDYRVDENKVKGCQSQVWLFPEVRDGKIFFQADSDASIVKGIISLLLSIYSDASPSDILATPPDFLKDIGLAEHLSMSRANGLNSMMKQISLYALAIKTKAEMGLI
jgi:cysteine desulfuration protein SufE